jgi:hypothetical protein
MYINNSMYTIPVETAEAYLDSEWSREGNSFNATV